MSGGPGGNGDILKKLWKTTTLGGNLKSNLMIGTAILGGMALPGLLGGGAAAAGAGEAAGGAAAGAGGTLGGTAGMFGPTAAGSSLLGTYAAPAAATPFVTGVGAPAGLEAMSAGTAGMFGPSAAAGESLAAFGSPVAGGSSMTTADILSKISKLRQLTQQDGKPQQQERHSMQPNAVAPAGDPLEWIKRIYGSRV